MRKTCRLDHIWIYFVRAGKLRLFENQLLGKTPTNLRYLESMGKPIMKNITRLARYDLGSR